MKKFLLGVLVGIAVTIVAGFIGVFALAAIGGAKKPVIADSSTLILRMDGSIPETSPVEIPFLENQASLTVLDYYKLLRKAAADPQIKAVVFEPYGVDIGWAKMQELRESLLAFKKSGKPLLAYLHTPGTREYYLATACDKIYMNHEDYLNVKGLRAEAMFAKGALDKLGIEVETERIGRYKDAPDMFTRTSLSPDSRAVLESMLDGLYGNLVSVIASSRKKSVDDVKAMIDNGPFLASEAVSKGLVDGFLYEDELFGQLAKQLGQKDLVKASGREYAKIPASESGKRIAILTGEGDITRGSATDSGQGDQGITAFGFSKELRRLSNDDKIAGVILRIDSPGGDAIASDELLREVKLLSKKKPLVISMSDLAASGGYYMAVPGDPIVAYPNTLTGSIGIFFLKPTVKGLFDKIGITEDGVQRGKNADIDSLYQPLTADSRKKLHDSIEAFYEGFLQVVADGRHKKPSDIEPLAQGRVWLGSQAKDNGLVDELGGLDKAIEILKRRAKIGQGEAVQLVAYPPKRSIFEQLLNRGTESVLSSAVPRELQPLTKGINLKTWAKGGMMSYMPLRVEVQ